MALESIKSEIRNLTDDDHARLAAWIGGEEASRRRDEKASSVAVADTVAAMQASGRLPHPDAATEEQAMEDAVRVPEWRDPGTDHSLMYHYGDVVRYQGKLVRSTHRGLNHWAPGTLAFDGRIWEILEAEEVEEAPTEPEASETSDEPETEETTEQPTAPAFKQPSGGHDTYKQGDRVTYNGAVYESTIPNNVWSPDSYPQGWKKL